jgi:hypothetical protein
MNRIVVSPSGEQELYRDVGRNREVDPPGIRALAAASAG